MKKNVILAIVLCMICSLGQAKTTLPLQPVRHKSEAAKPAPLPAMKEEAWEFYSACEDPTPEELATLTSTHRLGDKVSFLYDSFKDTYVVKEEVVPGDPTRRTIIRKPAIYNAVRLIEKELSREVKKQTVSKETAEQQLINVLKVALAAIDSESDSFESALQEHKKDATSLLAVFERVNLKSIY